MSNDKVTPSFIIHYGQVQAENDALRARVAELESRIAEIEAQEPYAYEYGKSNGDGTFSVVIDKGSLVRVSDTVYKNGPPSSPVKDWPVKALYARPAAPQPVKEDK